MFKKIFLFSIISCLFISNFSFAQTSTSTGLIPKATGEISADCAKKAPAGVDAATYCGDYSLGDFISIGIVASDWVLGIIGSLTLVMFVYGGFLFLISSGSKDKIAEAQKIIVSSVIGLIIVFSSYLIIKFTIESIGANNSFQMGSKNTTIKESTRK